MKVKQCSTCWFNSSWKRDQTTPPSTPSDGTSYGLSASQSGEWSGYPSTVASWQDGARQFHTPQQGWRAWCIDDALLLTFDGAAWKVNDSMAAQFGVNTTADTINRFRV